MKPTVCSRWSLNEVRTDDFRAGIAVMIEFALHSTGNYQGYNFIEWIKEGGYERWVAAGKPDDKAEFIGNESRRMYYGPYKAKVQAGSDEGDRDYPKALKIS